MVQLLGKGRGGNSYHQADRKQTISEDTATTKLLNEWPCSCPTNARKCRMCNPFHLARPWNALVRSLFVLAEYFMTRNS